jgi:hypothetical protein
MVTPSTFPTVRKTGNGPRRFPWGQTLKDVVIGLGQAFSLVPMPKSELPEGDILVRRRDGWERYSPAKPRSK